MRLRSFIVRDMAEAMTLVRREMGPDAIIVTTRATEGGNLEVRAAVEAKPDGRAELDPDAASRGPLACLLYTSPSPRDQRGSRMPSSA